MISCVPNIMNHEFVASENKGGKDEWVVEFELRGKKNLFNEFFKFVGVDNSSCRG